jgi:hypothetical protein
MGPPPTLTRQSKVMCPSVGRLNKLWANANANGKFQLKLAEVCQLSTAVTGYDESNRLFDLCSMHCFHLIQCRVIWEPGVHSLLQYFFFTFQQLLHPVSSVRFAKTSAKRNSTGRGLHL